MQLVGFYYKNAVLVLFSTAISHLRYCIFVNIMLCGFSVFVHKKIYGSNCLVRTVENDKNMYLGTLRCVIPVVCVTNEREESVVSQHN